MTVKLKPQNQNNNFVSRGQLLISLFLEHAGQKSDGLESTAAPAIQRLRPR